ncbi:l-glutamine synthetase [Ruminococcus sp. CAG:379]|nr:l-glutamine synthetase [Ruminococcus sp. CAG:379]
MGPEQEYFLIDRKLYEKRRDLKCCGRTLFGARPPKGQELADHYFGSIPPRVSAFMAQLDRELWQLGVLAKTEHNEVAPAQHELAPIYTTTNLACDHNQLTMELMKTVAAQHGMACLLHEKPFAGVNGSGKHNNWSISTDTGMNLLEPGGTPYENAQFLLFLCAVIEAVDEYQDLLRVSVASAGNDHRLGANEAPPAIVSMFLGDELTDILHAIESGTLYVGKEQVQMEIGATVLPHFFRDATDRNRTSPFAFTGNKFEFRMLGSAQSIAGPNTVLNTIVADVLGKYADRLEHSAQFQKDLDELIRTVIHDHKRIIFNGNNYSPQWVAEAEQRGLTNLPGTPEALRTLIDPKNIALFTRHGVFTEAEVRSRYAILLENYSKIGHIEALTMIDMVNQEIIPAVVTYQSQLAQLAANKKLAQSEASTALEDGLLKKLSRLSECLVKRTQSLSDCLMEIKPIQDPYQLASAYRERIYPAMTELRCVADNLELICGRDHWPLPSYGDMLFSIE